MLAPIRHSALLAFAILSLTPVILAEEPESPLGTAKVSGGSGAYSIQAEGFKAWLVSTKDPAQRIKIPVSGDDDSLNPDDEFDLSLDDEWIFAGRHGGSCLRSGELYHRTGSDTVERLDDFDANVWQQATKLQAIKRDWRAAGSCAMTFFVGWSADSRRLLIGLLGGPDRRTNDFGYVYYNTKGKHFETSEYLRKLNAAKLPTLPCAEPLDRLPDNVVLKTRVNELDARLNAVFAARLAKYPDSAEENRKSQRSWIKARDNGLKLYVSSVPKKEQETRKLQFLADVIRSRIDSLNQSEEAFDFWERKAGN